MKKKKKEKKRFKKLSFITKILMNMINMTKKRLIQNLWSIFIVNNKYKCFLDSEKKMKDSLTHQARLEEEGRVVRGVEGQKLMEV